MRPSGSSGRRFMFDFNEESEKWSFNEHPAAQKCKMAFKVRMRFLEENKIPESIWVHCLKDERRKMAKITSGETRLFTMAPLDLYLVVRCLFGDFVESFYQCKDFWSGIAINPHSREWDDLAEYLNEYGDHKVDGDFKHYDGDEEGEIMYKTVDLANKWYEKHMPGDLRIHLFGSEWIIPLRKACRMRETVFYEYVHTVMLVLNVMHRKSQGNPSGGPLLTSVVNTVTNKYLTTTAYVALAWKNNHDYLSYDKFVKSTFGGDDNIHGIHPAIIGWFNFFTMRDFFAGIGYTYTTASKDGTEYRDKPLSQCTFFKRGFVYDKAYRRWKAPIDVNTIQELTNWIRLAPDPLEACIDNCTEALKEASYHGVEYFTQFRAKLDSACSDADVPHIPFSYETYMLEWSFA